MKGGPLVTGPWRSLAQNGPSFLNVHSKVVVALFFIRLTYILEVCTTSKTFQESFQHMKVFRKPLSSPPNSEATLRKKSNNSFVLIWNFSVDLIVSSAPKCNWFDLKIDLKKLTCKQQIAKSATKKPTLTLLPIVIIMLESLVFFFFSQWSPEWEWSPRGSSPSAYMGTLPTSRLFSLSRERRRES